MSATATPTARVGRAWVVWLSLISIGIWAGFFGPIQVLLAQQAQAIDPAHKETVLAVVTGAGAFVSTVLNPVWGAFSDRTVLRIGRRLPWVIGGLVAGVVAMLLLSQATTVVAMVAAWCLAQAALNAMLAAITATVPDQVPVVQRGAVGGWLAIAQTLGVVLGSGIATATGSIEAGYLTTAGLLVVLALPYCFDSRDVPLAREDRPPFEAGRFVRSFWVSPRLHPDFAWAWVTRFLMNIANALLLLYLLYYLQDAVGLTRKQAEAGVFRLTLLYAVLTVVTAILGGIWSDRVGQRKVFVTVSGYVIAAALVLLAFVHSYAGAYVGAAVLGIGFGIYTAVDFALITQVLPADADRGKDLGVINIANALPQVLAPGIAAVVLGLGAGYSTLYLLAALAAVLGSVLVRRIVAVP